MTSSNKIIAKNTIYLYIRLLFTMIVSLYTSRVILQILGVDNYGIYKTVGGIVGFLSFINNALSIGTSRFITFGLGENDLKKLKNVFSTTLIAHVFLAFLIVILAETVGLWFLQNKLVIATDRMNAAEFVFHFSVLTAFFSLTQVPYTACIIAHEKVSIYAYVSIVEVIMRLLIVYLLTIGDFDKLKLYALLLCLIQVGINIFYRFYCTKNFSETKFRFFFDKSLFKKISIFSSWSLFANISTALTSQGVLVLLNMFFSPAIVAARAISLQVNTIANQFVSNFQTAANPQIFKRYAAKDYEGSKQILLQTAKFSFYLMMFFCIPILFGAKQILTLWLKSVPEYTVIFLQLVIIESQINVFNTSFYKAFYAKGRLRETALISSIFGFVSFPVVYILFKFGFSPIALSWATLISNAILGIVIKPLLIVKIVGYKWGDIFSVFSSCFKVLFSSLIIPLFLYIYFDKESNIVLLITVLVSLLSVAVSIWFLGLDKMMRSKIIEIVKMKINGRKISV